MKDSCSANCGGNYFFLTAGIVLLLGLIWVAITNFGIKDYYLLILLILVLLGVIIFLIMVMKNYSVSVVDNSIIYVDWKKKKYVFDLADATKIDTNNGKGLRIKFGKTNVRLYSYFKNFKTVRDEIALLYTEIHK